MDFLNFFSQTSLKQLLRIVVSNQLTTCFSIDSAASIGNGTTAGRLRTNATATFHIGQYVYAKASTDDLWNLSAETDTTSTQYRAYWLYLNAAGTASFEAGTNSSSEDGALLGLPTLDTTKSIIGVFVAEPSCDFNHAGGLATQGTIYDGIPEGVNIGISGGSDIGYLAPTTHRAF